MPGHSLTPFLLSPVGTVDVGKARLMFWDLGGQEELQSLWDKVRQVPQPACPSCPVSRRHPGLLLFTQLTFLSAACHPCVPVAAPRPQSCPGSLVTPEYDDTLGSFRLRGFIADKYWTRRKVSENRRGKHSACVQLAAPPGPSLPIASAVAIWPCWGWCLEAAAAFSSDSGFGRFGGPPTHPKTGVITAQPVPGTGPRPFP